MGKPSDQFQCTSHTLVDWNDRNLFNQSLAMSIKWLVLECILCCWYCWFALGYVCPVWLRIWLCSTDVCCVALVLGLSVLWNILYLVGITWELILRHIKVRCYHILPLQTVMPRPLDYVEEGRPNLLSWRVVGCPYKLLLLTSLV